MTPVDMTKSSNCKSVKCGQFISYLTLNLPPCYQYNSERGKCNRGIREKPASVS